ncbi:hypothetical protein WA026_014124 [Henosepilachna vigintioctopunctata]|uniref:Uncharacterized protein n=1 Tax=Henosepilachna vigintioctopunctata TaxID=420089 RepID=A0AAW1TKE1_9CUCU
MEHDLYGAQRKVWKMLKNRKKPVNEYVQTKIISPDIWEKYFTELYQDEEPTDSWVNEDETPDDVLITEEELDRIRNTDIRARCGIADIVRWGRQRRREWYAHVRRMHENILPRIMMESTPHGKRPPGRPPKMWQESGQSTSQETIQRRLQQATDQ